MAGVIIDVPRSLSFRNAEWKYVKPQQVNVSEWTGEATTINLPGAPRWTVSAELVPVIGEVNSLDMQGFLADLDGSINAFRMVAVEGPQHPGAEPVQTGGAAGGRTLTLSGLPVGGVALRKGRKITVKLAGGMEQLLRLTAPLVGDAGGNGTATVESVLRAAAATGVTAGTRLPWALVKLDSPDTGHAVDAGQIYSFGITATERFKA